MSCDLYSTPAILYLLFDILWMESVNRKGRRNFAAFFAYFIYYYLYFVAISDACRKNEVSMTFGLWCTYLRANLLALTIDGFIRHLYMCSKTCPTPFQHSGAAVARIGL